MLLCPLLSGSGHAGDEADREQCPYRSQDGFLGEAMEGVVNLWRCKSVSKELLFGLLTLIKCTQLT